MVPPIIGAAGVCVAISGLLSFNKLLYWLKLNCELSIVSSSILFFFSNSFKFITSLFWYSFSIISSKFFTVILSFFVLWNNFIWSFLLVIFANNLACASDILLFNSPSWISYGNVNNFNLFSIDCLSLPIFFASSSMLKLFNNIICW